MQTGEIQAFVRLGAAAKYSPVRFAGNVRGWTVYDAFLLPNCTDEVAEAVKASRHPAGRVQDLRGLERAHAIRVEPADAYTQSLAHALDMPEGRPFAEYVEAVSDLKSDVEWGVKVKGFYRTLREQLDLLLGIGSAAVDYPTAHNRIVTAVSALKNRLSDYEDEAGYEPSKKRLAPETPTLNVLNETLREAYTHDTESDPVSCGGGLHFDTPEALAAYIAKTNRRAGAVSAQEYENVRADNEMLRLEVARLDKIASELQESFNEVREREKRLRDDLKYLDRKFTEHCDEMCKALGSDLKLSPGGCVAEVRRIMRNRINVLPDESVPRGKMVFYDPGAPKHVVVQRAYNQGCADTVAAFRKAQGGE